MRRFFVAPQALEEDAVPLTGEVLHHLRSVLRLEPDQELLLLDGEGTLCRCRIETLGKDAGTARVLHRWHEDESAVPLKLIQALPKGDKLALVLQKGTELGVSTFAPVSTERSITRPAKERVDKQLSRWRRIIREAARQSLRPRLPRICAPAPLSRVLGEVEEDLRLMLWEEGSRPLDEVLPATPPRSVALLVGPEGGLTGQEAEMAAAAGFVAIRLGPRILRTETAGFTAAAILQYLYGDLAGHSMG